MVVLFLTACVFVSCTKTDVNAIPGKYDPNGKPPGSTTGGTIGGIGATNSDSTSVALFYSPDDVAVDAAGNLYVADYGNNLIRKITTAGMVTTFAGNGTIGANNGPGAAASFSGPSGVAVDNAGNVYVADAGNNLIRKITPDGTVSTLAGTVAAVDTSNTVTSEPLFSGPSGVAVDASGNVYVADAGNNEIRVVSPSGVVNTLAGNLNAGYADGTGSNARFNNPTGVAVDVSGNVYVADLLNNLIRKIGSGGVVSTLAGGDTARMADGKGALASFYFPNSLTVDASGNLYVTDALNNLIRKVTSDGTVTTIAGNGTAGFLNGTGTATSFNDPAGIAVDGIGNLFVADANNNLIRKITPAGQVTTVAGAVPSSISVRRNNIHSLYHIGMHRLNNQLSLKSKLR